MKNKLFLLSAFVCLALASCDTLSGLEGDGEPERKALKVKVMAVDSLSNYSSFTYVGSIQEGASVPMSLLAGGSVKSVKVHDGDVVSKGQLLMTADATAAQAMLSTARAKLQQAEDGYARVKKVYDAGGVSEVKFMEVKTQLDEARSAVAGLQKQVSDCSLRAPIAGIVCNCTI